MDFHKQVRALALGAVILASAATLDAGTLNLKAGYAFQPFKSMGVWSAWEYIQIGSHLLLKPSWEFELLGLVFGVGTGLDLNSYRLPVSLFSSNGSGSRDVVEISILRIPVEVTAAKAMEISDRMDFMVTAGITADVFLLGLVRSGKSDPMGWISENPRAPSDLRFGFVAKAGLLYKMDDHLRLSGELPIRILLDPGQGGLRLRFVIGLDLGVGYSFS